MSAATPDLPVWAQWFAALAVPLAAVFGVALGIGNLLLAIRKRKDELFERRIELFEKFRDFVVNHVYGEECDLYDLPPGMCVKLIEPWIYRIELVFSRDLAQELRRIDYKEFFFPNNNPLVLEGQLHGFFAPYLRIGA